MANLDELSDINLFFYYGLLSEELEMEHNLMVGLTQPERSFYYDRTDSVGVGSFENHPNDLTLQILLRFQIADWVNYFNSYTGDGTGLSKERRMAASQFAIEFYANNDALDIDVLYIPFADYSQMKSLKTSIGI
jgi:homoaconitase/3-isopropylmalate dehydratase large subunit